MTSNSPFAHISGALVRLQQFVPDTESFNEEDLPYVHAEFQAVMTGLLHAFPGRVVESTATGNIRATTVCKPGPPTRARPMRLSDTTYPRNGKYAPSAPVL